jgi:hypothetical protein
MVMLTAERQRPIPSNVEALENNGPPEEIRRPVEKGEEQRRIT